MYYYIIYKEISIILIYIIINNFFREVVYIYNTNILIEINIEYYY